MSRLSIVVAMVASMVVGAGTIQANDYLVGGMFTTPHVTHYRTVQTGQVAFYAPQCCPQTGCQPANGCAQQGYAQTAFYPQAQIAQQRAVVAFSPVAAMPYQQVAQPVVQPVVAARPVVVRSKFYVPYQPIRNVGRFFVPGVPTVVPYGAAY